MEQILGQIGDTLGGVFGSPIVRFGLQAIGFYLVILWLASAYWAFRDMQQRSDNAILPYLAAALIILFTPIFFIFAVWVYKIVRPHEKIGEVWERNLAEEALLERLRRSVTVPPASGGSMTSGSSARAAARASIASARTAVDSSVSTGRSAPGAARTSSVGRSQRRRRGRCRRAQRRPGGSGPPPKPPATGRSRPPFAPRSARRPARSRRPRRIH